MHLLILILFFLLLREYFDYIRIFESSIDRNYTFFSGCPAHNKWLKTKKNLVSLAYPHLTR